MYSISQNLKNVLKNKIKIIISPILYKTIDFMVDNLFAKDVKNKYFSLISGIQTSTREIVKSIIVSTFKEIDEDFKNSAERKSIYYINKSNVQRTLITIVGEISFERTYYQSKRSNKKFFYIDEMFDLPKYDHYDPIIKGIAIQNATETSQAQSSRTTTAMISEIKFLLDNSSINNIPRQSIYNWIREWNTPEIVPESVETPETLYVMADEKYIGAQDIDKDIMVKCFVTFEDIKSVGLGRRALVNRTVFSCYDSHAWPKFMDFIAKRYDFSKIKNIRLLGDGGIWIKSGVSEFRLDQANKVKFYLCEFHFKQAIHHITTDENERNELISIFKNKKKKDFVTKVEEIIKNNSNRENIIRKKLDYILNNYTAIKSMLELKIGSSMESHISHLIASLFASRPKGFSTKRIHQYLRLNDYKNNNVNIFKLYLQSYKNDKVLKINEECTNDYVFENFENGNIPILCNGLTSNTYFELQSISHWFIK